ncbi:protein FAM83A-like isoform X2 [Myripristis murdjan]|uniref:protein FAM83A-like isoform X2 n=1 Tax=Myripristis murdjan TaxID=586833 RepID=UPI001175D8DA|nr:protein FAM83A isoform X2 [Myripristis murdjan]
MDADGLSVLWYMRSKPVGKVRRRVPDLRVPSAWYCDPLACKPKLDLSHNEGARLAADALLSRGLVGYREVLNAEGEVDFLSEPEKKYILAHGRHGNTDAGTDDDDDDEDRLSADSQSSTRCPAVSTDSDTPVPGLDNGPNGSRGEWVPDVESSDPAVGQPSAEVYVQSDSTAACIKDLVREFIRKASTVLHIVMDTFSDVELLCDVLEASRKRNVTVYLLLDHLNLNLFLSMWQDLKLNHKNFPKLSIHSVEGQTYCAKTGRKLSGQVTENFIISDWTEVLTGSYSFSWLSWQVHRSLAVLLKGSLVTPFHQEFKRLYSSSKLVTNFSPVPHNHPPTSYSTCTAISRPSQTTTICERTWTEKRKPGDAQNIQAEAKMPADVQCAVPGSSKLQSTEPRPLYKTQTHEQSLIQTHIQTEMHPKPLVQAQFPPGIPGVSTLRILQNVSMENPRHTVGGSSIQQKQTNPAPLQQNQKAQPKPLLQVQNQTQTHSKPVAHTPVPYLQSQPAGLTTTAERTVKVQEPNTPPAAPAGLTTLHKPEQSKIRGLYSQATQHNKATLGLFPQESSRNSRLAKGSEIAEGQQNYPRTFIPNRDSLLDKSQVLSCPTTPHKQAQGGPPCTFTHLRGHTSGLEIQMGAKRQIQPQKHFHSPLQSHVKVDPSDSKSMGTNLKSQLQTDPKWFSPGVGTKPHPQSHSPHTFTPPTRLNWISQRHAARPTPVVRQRSFSSAYGTGQTMGGQLGWRPLQSSVMTSLGRSKSLNDRNSALFKGSSHNPNISKT